MTTKLIGYRRVSTQQQGESGLGLDAQTTAINGYTMMVGGQLVQTYTEVETAKRDELENRPELCRALAHCRRMKATLVIAKLDRLVRSTVAMAAIKTSGVSFVACDNPHANELTIDILVAVAANEARVIRERTRAALAAYRANGYVSKRIRKLYPDGVPDDVREATAGRLGGALTQCRNLSDDARRKGQAAACKKVSAQAAAAYTDLLPTMLGWRAEGMSNKAIARRLNSEGQTTRRGKEWSHVQVARVLDRAGSNAAA
jgi:DNA invertase Pin-like site-specific DNA recombinase